MLLKISDKLSVVFSCYPIIVVVSLRSSGHVRRFDHCTRRSKCPCGFFFHGSYKNVEVIVAVFKKVFIIFSQYIWYLCVKLDVLEFVMQKGSKAGQ